MDKVVHFEIPADNVARCKEFYEKAFGWQITLYPMPGMEYYGIHTVESDEKGMPKTLGAINGGMQKRDGTLKTPAICAKVEDIDAALKRIEELGGKVIAAKVNIGGMGWYARILDTEGNVTAVWQDIKQ